MLRKVLLLVVFILTCFSIYAQPGTGYQKSYQQLTSGNTVADKNFYLVTAIQKTPGLLPILTGNETLAAIAAAKWQVIHTYAEKKTIKSSDSVLYQLLWTTADSLQIDQQLRLLYQADSIPFTVLINKHLRPSGCYQLFARYSNEDFLLRAWAQYMKGTNYIINQFGLGKKLRYPAIDSASYYTQGDYFQSMLAPLFNMLEDGVTQKNLLYEPALQVALWLMDMNDRNEPAQFEPLERGENKAAATRAMQISWNKYRYAALLVPGEGPELAQQALSPGGKMRCRLAATRYKQGLAPFIIVSGGNCHPFHTPYNEAIEMKKHLIQQYNIPENAIIIEPQARHTTTNFRNGNRLLIRYAFPLSKPVLCVTASDQAAYIADKRFDNRNIKELGYLPYRDKQSLSVHESSFYVVLESLHMDPTDPLDP